jgi:hypothetical protein
MPSLIPKIAIAALCLRLSLPTEKNIQELDAIALRANWGTGVKPEPARADFTPPICALEACSDVVRKFSRPAIGVKKAS